MQPNAIRHLREDQRVESAVLVRSRRVRCRNTTDLGRKHAAYRGCRVVLGGEGTEWLAHERFSAADLLRRLDLAGSGGSSPPSAVQQRVSTPCRPDAPLEIR